MDNKLLKIIPLLLTLSVTLFYCLQIKAASEKKYILNNKTIHKYEKKYGAKIKDEFHLLLDMVNRSTNNEIEKIRIVNVFFNRYKFFDDIIHWKKEDYWATPTEFIASGAGDCEDFSISKYYTLIKMGVPEEKLTLTYVKSLQLNQAHMVVSYYPSKNEQPLILDNLDKAIKPSVQRKDLLPVYSVNGSGLWIAKQEGRGKLVGDGRNLQKWTDLSERINQDDLLQ